MEGAVSTYLAFVAATVLLIAIPGPNVAIIVANSAAHGLRYGLLTVAGTSTAMVFQLTLTVAGLSGLLSIAGHAFEILRWAGVLYLVYLALEVWHAPAPTLVEDAQPKAGRRIFMRGFLVSLSNPKTLLFYAAFLPQFVPPGHDPTVALTVLALTFIFIAIVLDSLWAVLASQVRRGLVDAGRHLNRLTAAILMLGAAALALARRP